MLNNLKDFRTAMVDAGYENKMSGSIYEFYEDGELVLEIKQRNRKEYGIEFYTSHYDDDWFKHWKRITVNELNNLLDYYLS